MKILAKGIARAGKEYNNMNKKFYSAPSFKQNRGF